jgi:hypothetical protein
MAKKEGIGPVEVLDRVTMQLFVREHFTVIAAPVQCDVDGIPKGSHSVRVPIIQGHSNDSRFAAPLFWRRAADAGLGLDLTTMNGAIAVHFLTLPE